VSNTVEGGVCRMDDTSSWEINSRDATRKISINRRRYVGLRITRMR
jgi:hypothetical protein